VKVTDPAGRSWLIARRVLPWRRRLHKPDWAWDVPDFGGGDDLVSAIVLAITLPIAIILAVLLSELLLLLLLLPVVLALRIVFRRPWIVDVRPADAPRTVTHLERVVGWRAAGERVQELAKGIAVSGLS
jgi:hypothetical protein